MLPNHPDLKPLLIGLNQCQEFKHVPGSFCPATRAILLLYETLRLAGRVGSGWMDRRRCGPDITLPPVRNALGWRSYRPLRHRDREMTHGEADREIRHNVSKSINNVVKLLLLVTHKGPAQNKGKLRLMLLFIGIAVSTKYNS